MAEEQNRDWKIRIPCKMILDPRERWRLNPRLLPPDSTMICTECHNDTFYTDGPLNIITKLVCTRCRCSIIGRYPNSDQYSSYTAKPGELPPPDREHPLPRGQETIRACGQCFHEHWYICMDTDRQVIRQLSCARCANDIEWNRNN